MPGMVTEPEDKKGARSLPWITAQLTPTPRHCHGHPRHYHNLPTFHVKTVCLRGCWIWDLAVLMPPVPRRPSDDHTQITQFFILMRNMNINRDLFRTSVLTSYTKVRMILFSKVFQTYRLRFSFLVRKGNKPVKTCKYALFSALLIFPK